MLLFGCSGNDFSKTGICSTDASNATENTSTTERKRQNQTKTHKMTHKTFFWRMSKWYALILHLAWFGLTPYVRDVYYYITLGNRQELKTLWVLGLTVQKSEIILDILYCREGGELLQRFRQMHSTMCVNKELSLRWDEQVDFTETVSWMVN